MKIVNIYVKNPSTSFYYGINGNAISADEWAHSSIIDIAKSTVGNFEVSTIFTGLNLNFGHPVPHIFETMIFKDGVGGACWRWSTVADAEQGHQDVVAWLEGKTRRPSGG